MKRLQDIEINLETGSLNIDILKHEKPFVIVYSGGKAKLKELPEHGETKIITHQGKVKRVRQDEGEEF